MYVNHVYLAGNLVRDPEVAYYEGDKKVTRFSVAVNKMFTDGQGNKKQDTCFVSCVCFDGQADSVSKYLKKGSSCFVEGELQNRTWEKDGEKKSMLMVKAKRVQFVGKFDLGEKK